MQDQAKTKEQLIDELNQMCLKITLRDLAENKLRKSQVLPQRLEDKAPDEIIHELRVYQIELEMQNEELENDRLTLEESKYHYQDVCDFAPDAHSVLTPKFKTLESR
jgi:hypothetical protein